MDITKQFGKKLVVKDEVCIEIGSKIYSYFMTNNYVVLGEKLKEFALRNVRSSELSANPALSQSVRNEMEKLGVCWSVTVSNGAKVLNYYTQAEGAFVVLLDKLKKSTEKRAKNLTEEHREKVLNDILEAFSAVWDNPEQDMNILHEWDYALFCAKLVRGKPSQYYLYLMMNLFHLNFRKTKESFSEVLDRFIVRYIDGGKKTGSKNKLSDIYKNSCMNKQTFSRIRSGKIAQPTFDSVMQLALGMKLSWLDLLILLDSSGHIGELREKMGHIVFEEIIHENYNIDRINEKLYASCGRTLGLGEK